MALTSQPLCRQSKIPVREAPQGAGTGCADTPSYSHKCHVISHPDGCDYVYERTVVHSFRMNDVDDPELYAAGPLWDWEKSEQGTWCFEHAAPHSLHYPVDTDFASYGYRVIVYGWFRKEDLVYFYLKWPQTS